MKRFLVLILLAGCGGTSTPVTAPGQTMSNAPDRSRYLAFFQRTARLVKSQWAPGDLFHQADPDGHKYGTGVRNLTLDVTLTRDGTIADARVYQSSGVDFLDSAAESAVRGAAPIPNPPPGLFTDAEQVTFQLTFRFEPTAPEHADVRPVQ